MNALPNPFFTSATGPAGAIVAGPATATEETSVPVAVAELFTPDQAFMDSLYEKIMREPPPLFLRKLLEIAEGT